MLGDVQALGFRGKVIRFSVQGGLGWFRVYGIRIAARMFLVQFVSSWVRYLYGPELFC